MTGDILSYEWALQLALELIALDTWWDLCEPEGGWKVRVPA